MAETQPMMLQALCYTAPDFRNQLASLVCVEGVANLMEGSLLVTTGGSGLDLFVAEGMAFVDSDVDDQGMYSIFNDGTVTVTATAANATNPRIDQVIATVSDSQLVGTDNEWVLSVLAGTPTVGATLANLNGAAALPDRSIRLAYVLVPATFAGPFVDATHILDYRTSFELCGKIRQPYVQLEPAAATSIPNTGVFTQPTMGTVVHNDDEYFSVSGATITVLKSGLYDFQASNTIAGDPTGVRLGRVLKNNTNLPNASPNGTIVGNIFLGVSGSSNSIPLVMTRQAHVLAAGDTLKVAFAQNGSGALDTLAAGPFAHFTVRKVN